MADISSGKLDVSIKSQDNLLPYRLRERFLSTPEVALYRTLVEMSEGRYVICPKVALNDIFLIVRPNENVHYFNKIFRKHVDFLLCQPRTFKPEIGVELVKPISKNETRTSDRFMEDLFLTAGLPLVHVPSGEHYEIADVVALFQLAVAKAKQDSRAAQALHDSVPACPICGKMMVLRTYRSGPQAGRLYYGCIDSPKCPGMVAIKR
jgi:hypothetical protein